MKVKALGLIREATLLSSWRQEPYVAVHEIDVEGIGRGIWYQVADTLLADRQVPVTMTTAGEMKPVLEGANTISILGGL